MTVRGRPFSRYVLVVSSLLLGGIALLTGLFATYNLVLSSRFPFAGSGGFRNDASLFTVGPSGLLSRHSVCVAPARVAGAAYFLRVGPELPRQLQRQPFVFYEGDAGSGVAPWCAFPLGGAPREDATRATRESCGEADLSEVLYFALRNPDACARPADIVYDLED